MRKPLPHQRRVLDWAEGRDRAAFFLRMRLGKTFCSIRWAKGRMRADSRAMVVAPQPALPGWLHELELEGESATWLVGSSHAKRTALQSGLQAGHRWFVVNPEGLRAAPELGNAGYDVVILDESPFIKSPASRTQITKVCHKAFRGVENKAILSGMPDPESRLDYFEQMAWLNDGAWLGCRNFWEFRNRFFTQYGFDYVLRRGREAELQAAVAEQAYVMTLEDAGLQGTQVHTERYLELPRELRRVYRKVVEDFVLGESETDWVPVQHSWLAQIAGGSIPKQYRPSQAATKFSMHKVRELKSLLTGELRGEPAVVFFRFNREIKVAYDELRQAGLKPAVFTGWTKPRRRRAIVEKFQRGVKDVLLCQGKAARYGLDFSRATAAIFFSNWEDWNTRDQLEARIQHPTKKEPALYIDLLTRGTVDEKVHRLLRGKKRSQRKFAAELKRLIMEEAR